MLFENSITATTATVLSVTPTAITVMVPGVNAGNISVRVNNQVLSGPAYTITSAANIANFTAPYVTGNVELYSQQMIDTFAELNKNNPQLHINGSLNINPLIVPPLSAGGITSLAGLSNINSVSGAVSISYVPVTEAPFLSTLKTAGSISLNGNGFNTLNFDNLTAAPTSISIMSLKELNSISLNGLSSVNTLSIINCAKLADLSFLSKLTAAGSISLQQLPATALGFDNLTAVTSGLSISQLNNLQSVNCPQLKSAGILSLSGCSQLSNISLGALTTLTGRLSLSGLALANLDAFRTLQTAGSLYLNANGNLSNLTGLERLTTLTAPTAVSAGITSFVPSRANGIVVTGNPKLTSLNGLQNIRSALIAYITGNATLTDLCPLKARLSVLSNAPAITYTYTSQLPLNSISRTITAKVAALTLSSNGTYATQQDNLDALDKCK